MTAAALFNLALAAAERHGEHCPVCDPPSLDRCGAGCRHGRALDQAYLTAWRRRVDALTVGRLR